MTFPPDPQAPLPRPVPDPVNAPERIDKQPPDKITAWWCPRCRVVSERRWHFCKKGVGLIPQTDVETECEPVAYRLDRDPTDEEVERAADGYIEAVIPQIVMTGLERHRRKIRAALRAARGGNDE